MRRTVVFLAFGFFGFGSQPVFDGAARTQTGGLSGIYCDTFRQRHRRILNIRRGKLTGQPQAILRHFDVHRQTDGCICKRSIRSDAYERAEAELVAP